MILSNKVLQFNYVLKAFVAYIIIHYLELGISLEQKDGLALNWTDWGPVIDTYTNPNSHNTISIGDMSLAYTEDKRIVDGVKLQIKSNPSIELTPIDYANLDIPKPNKSKTRVPAVNYAPVVSCIRNTHLLPVYFAGDPNQPARVAKPPKVGAIGVKICYTDATGTAPPLDDYRVQQQEGKTEFEQPQTAANVGKKLWTICFYLSPTGEAGPDSEPCSVIIV
jgi:hypothetical protein